MKKMTCKQMGGPCEYEMTANSAEEMMKMGGDHVMKTMDKEHMKIAEEMKNNMDPKSKKEWNDMFMKKWDAMPDAM